MADHMTAEQLRAELTHVASEFDKYAGMDLTARQLRIAVTGMADDIRDIAARLSGMAADLGWISVADRLPTEKRDYLIYYANYREQAVSEFLPEEDPPGFWHGDPTHWRELPAAPEPPHV